MSPAPRPAPPGPNLISRFRGSVRVRAPLHPLERAVLVALCVHLGFLPWAVGTMHPWSQVTSLCLAAAGFLLALIPRRYAGDYAAGVSPVRSVTGDLGLGRPTTALEPPITSHQSPRREAPASLSTSHLAARFTYKPHARLIRFPLFWLGAALLAYIAVQGANPSWVWERNETSWWLRRVNDVAWLPTSIDAPWARFNLWRQFVIYASAWLTVCTLWIGLTRRRSLELLLTFLVVNACLFAAAGIVQKLAGQQWIIKALGRVPNYHSFAAFIYHNHAGAYLALMTAAAAALGMGKFDRGERAMKRSTPAGLFAAAALFLGGTVLFTWSRGAVLTLALFLILFAGWFFLRRRLRPSDGGNPAVAIAVAALFAVVIGFAASLLDFSAIAGKFDRLIEQQSEEHSAQGRIVAFESAQRMLAENWERGVGAGGFRHLFPEYIKRHPDFYKGGRLFWEHAHNDWLQIPIELGAGGSVLVLVGGGWWLIAFFRRRPAGPTTNNLQPGTGAAPSPAPVWHPLAVPVLLGCAQTLVHAWIDFPFQNPAILISWAALLVLALATRALDA